MISNVAEPIWVKPLGFTKQLLESNLERIFWKPCKIRELKVSGRPASCITNAVTTSAVASDYPCKLKPQLQNEERFSSAYRV